MNERLCPDCGELTYSSWYETFGPTGGLRSRLVYRHDSTGYIVCPRRKD